MKTQIEKLKLFVPGRLCLFGEHSDWAGLHRIINADIVPGAAIVTGIEQGIYAEVEKCDQFIMHNESEELKDLWVDFSCSMQSFELRAIAETNQSEIDMTDSLRQFIGKGLTGVVLNGTMYDIGNPSSYHVSFDDFNKL